MDRGIGARWVKIDDRASYRLAALGADVIDHEVQRHEFPLLSERTPNEVAASLLGQFGNDNIILERRVECRIE
jgi:hypothetical protein